MVENEVFLVDGGKFICYEHDFEALTQEEWDAHRSTNHTVSGTAPCMYCGIKTDGPAFEIMPDIQIKAICEFCGPLHGEEPNGVRK
jgi:hypothetical protein